MFFMIYLDSNFVQDWREDKGEDEEDESDSRGRKEEEGRADRAVDGSLKRRTNERPTDSLTHSLAPMLLKFPGSPSLAKHSEFTNDRLQARSPFL